MWYVYLALCGDGTYYTGIAKDLSKRIDEHNNSESRGARYTRSRRPVKLVYCEKTESRSKAMARETEIKKMGRKRKKLLADAGCLNMEGAVEQHI